MTKPLSKKFAAKFSEQRKLKKMKYRELNETTGISIPNLCDILKGRTNVTIDNALKISKALDFSLDEMKGLV